MACRTALALLIAALSPAALAQPAPDGDAAQDGDAAPDGDAAQRADDEALEPEVPDAVVPDEDGDDAPADGGDGAAPVQRDPVSPVAPPIEIREPPILWQEWTIRGNLSSRERDTLRSFFAPEMKTRQSLTQASREELAAFAHRLGYHLLGITAEQSPRGTIAVLQLEPVALVRRVKVNIDNEPWRFYEFDTIFDDEIMRRMRLRAGSPLPRDKRSRAAQLRIEAERIADHLRHEGYFEARVSIRTRPDGNGVRLEVNIEKGPRYELGEIKVVGNEAVSTEEIVALFRHGQFCVQSWCLYDRFSRQNVNKDIQRVVALYQKRGYPAVRVTTDFDLSTSFNRSTKTVEFTVIVNERRKIDVVFEGNDPDRFSDDKLTSLLTFDVEGSYDEVEVEASAEAIRRFYQSRGYFEASVTFQRERFRFFERIVFTIHAGARLTLRSVTIEGNQAIDSRELSGIVRTRARPGSPLFTESGYVTSAQLRHDIARITEHYRKNGFGEVAVHARVSRSPRDRDNAAVLAALVASVAASDGLYVTFHVDEGPQTRIEEVRFEFVGEHASTAAGLTQILGFKAGDPFHDERIKEGQSKLERHFFQLARPNARIAREITPGSTPELMRVTYRVTENHQVRFGKVLVQGNFKTEDWVILDELGYREGVPLSLRRAEAGQQNLRASGLFRAVQVDFLNLDQRTENDVNVIVRVEERYDYRLGLEAAGGYSTDAGAFGQLALINPNFLGKGLRVDLRGQYGTQFSSLEGKFIAPRWTVRRLARKLTADQLSLSSHFELAAFWRRETTERFGDLSSFGTSVAISKLYRRGLFEGVLVSLRYDLRQRNREENLMRGAGPSDDIEKAPVSTRTGAIGPHLVIDRRRDRGGRPNPLTPESGYRIELRALVADPALLGQDRFIKLGMSGQHFYKPSKRLLISNGVRYDHGIPLSSVLLPVVERYFAGGDTTVRGFEEDRLAAEIIEDALPPLGDVSHIRILPAGGNIRAIHNLDLQIEVWKLLDIPVASAVFLDTGLITNSLYGFKFTDLRHALGLALFRWVAPFGSISVEWAIPLDPQLGDDPRGRFHFNFGLLF